MINFLNSWAQKIIVVTIICSIIEMSLPEGKNKKYIKMVSGIYVVFTILGPIISKINLKDDLKIEKYLEKFNNNNVLETSINIDNNQYIEEVYKEKLCIEIMNNISKLGYKTNEINVEIETKDEKTYGNILYLTLKIDKINNKDEDKIKIEPVVIGKEKVEKDNKICEEEKEEIKTYLEKIYYIDKEKINIIRINCNLLNRN